MPQVTGTVYLYVNGKSLRSKDGAKLDTGGKERTAQVAGGQVVGFSEKVVPAKIEATLAHMADTKVGDLNGFTDATAVFECDTGVSYLIANAFTAKPVVITGGDGDAAIELQGEPAVEQ
jgi:hypothetical protein